MIGGKLLPDFKFLLLKTILLIVLPSLETYITTKL